MTCPLCSQPVTLPLLEVWCPACRTYVRTHDGCTPGVESTRDGVSNAAQARILAAHQQRGPDVVWYCDVTRLHRSRPWDPNRDALSEQPWAKPEPKERHVPGSTVPKQRRGP